ncbi:MAG: helix-turn-helix domain-containing protein [Pseudonocardiaceae bacterium]
MASRQIWIRLACRAIAEEREIISRELKAERSSRWIGRLLNRDHSVISCEIVRNGGRSAYRA